MSRRRPGWRSAPSTAHSAPPARVRRISATESTAALAVGVELALARHEIGDVDVIGEVEEHRAMPVIAATQYRTGSDSTWAAPRRNGRERHCADYVGRDEQRTAAVAIHPSSRRPGHQHAGKRQRNGQQAELVGGRVNDQDGGHRQRGTRNARADGGDALRAPQQQEIAMPPESGASDHPPLEHINRR